MFQYIFIMSYILVFDKTCLIWV